MMFEMSGWFIIPAMPTISLVLAWMSNIPNKPIRQLIAFTWMLISLSIPLHVSTGSVGSDYALAIVILCYSLKIIELFFCEPFATDIYSMPIFPFMVLLMTYQDPPQFQEWFDAASYPPNSSSSDKGSRSRVNSSSQQDKKEKEKEKKKIDAKFVIQKGRAHGLRLWMRAVGYWLGLNVVMAILPPNPSHAFQTWPRTSWQFWAFTFATACGAYLVMALAYSALMGFYAFLWGIYVKEIFNYPFFAYSLREWWSKRWNLCYKDQYFRIVFMALYGNEDKNININQHQHPQKLTASSSNKKSKIKATVAALATFLFSGIIHEYLAYAAFGHHLTWESTLFFLLQGLGTTVEVLFIPRSLNRHIYRALTFTFLTLTSPLFQGPYHRNDFYILFKVPYLPGVQHRYALSY